MSRFSVAKERVLDDLEGIVEQLLRASRKHHRRSLWNVCNPYRPKSKPEQMCVWLQGARRGAWKDFVSGDQGDAIDLVAYALTGAVTADTRMTALEWIEDRFGLKNMSPARRETIAKEATARRAAAEAKETARRTASRERARKFFYSCQPIEGSLAEVYLRSRNIDLAGVPKLGRALRFHPACEYWMIEERPRMPAMIAAMVGQDGKIGACHYTFLAPDGSGKADVPKAKLMFPETSGLVIRLTDGPSGLPAERAAEASALGLVGLVEGVEDGLSVAVAEPDLRMWSAGSLPGFGTVPDHGCVSSWLVFKDNDWGKRQAQQQFSRAVARLKGFGKPVEVISMPADWGKDVNDALRSGWK
ncbi:toprim domain-containing protein [Rhizobium sp. NPDC090275]|uniref:DUF7146 domain-containing protein n=1 Tax=Rhizobium sp. NPDC090275 TaxID=3364498 RepID=UPI003839FFED